MKPRYPIRVYFETWLAQIGFVTLPYLSRGAIVRIARFMGSMGYLFSSRLKRVGRVNLDIAFGDTKTSEEKSHILKKSYQSIALVLLDAFWFSRKTEQRIARWVRFEPSFNPLFQDKAHICVTAHYGNWEVLGMSVTSKGYPLHSVAKPLKNPHVDVMFIEARRKNGQNIVKREGAVRTLLRILQQGGKIALVLDQNTNLTEGGQFCQFFRLPVLVSTAVAGLALKTKTNIFIGMLIPEHDGTYRGDYGREIAVEPFLVMEQSKAVGELTQLITTELEHILIQEPDHWLWTYKRWKYVPDGDDKARFPFYSKPAI